MDIKMAAQTIRDTVSMDQILGIYGYQTKHGFMVCPFHGDRDASLKVYPGTGGWHCFGCGKGGSVIDFVMTQEGCDFRTAVTAIDHALRMGLRDTREDPYEAEKEKRRQEWLDDFVNAVYQYFDALKATIEANIRLDLARMQELEMMVATGASDRLKPADFDFMHMWKDNSEYNEYLIERVESLREEVAAWRRKARRAPSASSRKK